MSTLTERMGSAGGGAGEQADSPKVAAAIDKPQLSCMKRKLGNGMTNLRKKGKVPDIND